MKLFQRVFFAAVLAGLAAGLVMATLQQWRVVPLILAAEVFETASSQGAHADGHHDAATTDATAAPSAHEHDEEAWAPHDGVERTFYTVLSGVLAAMGFAFLTAGVAVVSGLPLTARTGLFWGLGGFIAFQLAPAMGLPPELPGMPAADLGARQLWWWATALSAGIGMLGIARFRNAPSLAVATLLILAPQIIGAPQLAGEHASSVPAELATRFAANSLGVGLAFWLILGSLLGWVSDRLAQPTAFTKEVPA